MQSKMYRSFTLAKKITCINENNTRLVLVAAGLALLIQFYFMPLFCALLKYDLVVRVLLLQLFLVPVIFISQISWKMLIAIS